MSASPASPALRGGHAAVVTRRWMLVTLLVVAGLALAALGVSRLLVWPAATDGRGVAQVLLETADEVDLHAAAMIDHGRRLADKARLSSGPNREHWIADGEHMVADGMSLQALARRLRASAAMLGSHPTERASVDLALYRGEGRALTTEGTAVMEHGRAMVEHARAMAELARDPASAITPEDVALMERGATGMVEAGRRAKAVGQRLTAFVEQMRRSLGQYP